MCPKVCPNCGAQFPEETHQLVAFGWDESEAIDGWDCYCEVCHWSGDICPDYAEGALDSLTGATPSVEVS